MTISTQTFISVNTGTVANDGLGDSLRAAFVKVNQNFSNISSIGFDAGNIIASGTVQADYFVGDGSLLTNLPAAANSAILASYVTGNVQANITSVGNLISLSSSGNIQTTQNIKANIVYTNGVRLPDGSDPFYPYTGNILVQGNLIVANTYVPASNTSPGTAGQIAWNNGNVYICVATNTWKRATLSTF